LQIVELNEKDIKDIIALLIDHELSDKEENDKINIKYIANLCSNDWGLQRTIEITLDRISEWVNQSSLHEEHKEIVISKVGNIKAKIDAEPKTLKWKIREKIGERVRWYEIPEEPLRGGFK
ncbi:MAG: hypothetical protein QXF51_06965, partial [Nitrososphaerota archaeon]